MSEKKCLKESHYRNIFMDFHNSVILKPCNYFYFIIKCFADIIVTHPKFLFQFFNSGLLKIIYLQLKSNTLIIKQNWKELGSCGIKNRIIF